jgi:hypothetical protein
MCDGRVADLSGNLAGSVEMVVDPLAEEDAVFGAAGGSRGNPGDLVVVMICSLPQQWLRQM